MELNTGNVIVLTLKRVRTDVDEESEYWHEPLDVNDVPTRLSGLPQAVKENAVEDEDYIAPYYNDGTCPLPVGNEIHSITLERNNCGEDETPSSAEYTVLPNTFMRDTLEEANTAAQADLDTWAQIMVNGGTGGVGVLDPEGGGTCTVMEFGNVLKSKAFKKSDCSAGSSGTWVTYTVPANTHTASSQTAADDLADEDIEDNGPAYANEEGSCLLNTSNALVSIDMYTDSNLDVCMYIDTVGVSESGVPVSRANNFYPVGSPAESALMLASDNIAQPTLKRRFILNIGGLSALYPDAGAIPIFTWKIRGRTQGTAGSKNGYWQREYPTFQMAMTGSEGSYIPTTTPTGGPTPTAWSKSVIGGGDGSVGVSIGDVILTITYNRGTDTVTVT